MLALNERATALAQGLIDQVGAGRWSAPTRCPGWDVRALLNHLVGGNRMVAALTAGEPPPDRGADVLGAEPAAAFAGSAAMRRDGSMGQTFRMRMGEVPGSTLAAMRLVETLIHAWDLA